MVAEELSCFKIMKNCQIVNKLKLIAGLGFSNSTRCSLPAPCLTLLNGLYESDVRHGGLQNLQIKYLLSTNLPHN